MADWRRFVKVQMRRESLVDFKRAISAATCDAPEDDGRYSSLCGRALSAQAIGRIMGRTKDTVKMSLDCVGGCKQKGSASFLYTFRMFHGIMDAEYGLPKV